MFSSTTCPRCNQTALGIHVNTVEGPRLRIVDHGMPRCAESGRVVPPSPPPTPKPLVAQRCPSCTRRFLSHAGYEVAPYHTHKDETGEDVACAGVGLAMAPDVPDATTETST